MFGFNKGTMKLKDLDEITVFAERRENGIFFHLEARLKDGTVREIGGVGLADIDRLHAKKYLLGLKLPGDKDWSRLKPDELTVNFGFLKATWKKFKP